MEKIEFRKVRDFGALFNDGILFLRKNFKSYFGTIVFLAGPFILITAILSGYMQSLQTKLLANNIFSGFNLGTDMGLFSANFFGTLGIFVLISLLTTLLTTACICLYFKEYDKASVDGLPLHRNLISPNLAGTAWRLFYNLLLLGVIFSIISLLLVGLLMLLFAIPVLNVLIGIAVVIGLIIILPVAIYVIYVAQYIVVRDEVLITDAVNKAIKYVKGNFWWTWLLIVAVGVAITTLVSIFQMPLTIINFTRIFSRAYDPAATGSDHSIMVTVFGALSVVGQLLVVSPVFYTFCILNFYNQEERKEGTGLMGRIDELDLK